MSGKLTRRGFLGGFLGGVGAGISTAAPAEAPLIQARPAPRPRPRPRRAAAPPVAPLDDLIRAANLGNARIGFVVADGKTGEVLEVHNPLLPLPPASVAKSMTALYGLDRLGAGFRFATCLLANGPVNDGHLQGDLILAGGGDPTLDTDRLGDMAGQLKAAGIQEVAGGFRVYAGAFPRIVAIDPLQPDHLGYNPAICGLNLNYNRVHFEWKRAGEAYRIVMDARAERYRPEVTTARMRIVERDHPVYTYEERQGGDDWTVARRALGSDGARWLPVRHPASYAAEVFQTLARAHGIPLKPPLVLRGVRPRGAVVVESFSDPLPGVLRGMLRYSTNLTAELVGLSAAARDGAVPESLQDSARRMNRWMAERYGLHRAGFVDHSGLGGDSRISASVLVRALNGAGSAGVLRPILKQVRTDELPGDLRAKTGTLNFVSALAGYYRTPQGRELTFATLCADVERRNALSRAEMERPPGAREWSRRARHLQYRLVNRWAALRDA